MTLAPSPSNSPSMTTIGSLACFPPRATQACSSLIARVIWSVFSTLGCRKMGATTLPMPSLPGVLPRFSWCSEARQHGSDASLLRVAMSRRWDAVSYLSISSLESLPSLWCLGVPFLSRLDIFRCISYLFLCVSTFSVASRCFPLRPDVFPSCPDVFSCILTSLLVSRCSPPFFSVFSSFRVSESCLHR